MERVPITTYGYALLDKELKERRDVRRPKITSAIEEARAHGDLKENAEYHAAKEEQGLNEARISQLESIISRAEVIDPTKLKGGKIVLGATVLLEDLNTEKSITYILVGPDEADIDKGLISTTSPIGRALLGKEVDDEITVRAPSGNKEYAIEEVKFVEINPQ